DADERNVLHDDPSKKKTLSAYRSQGGGDHLISPAIARLMGELFALSIRHFLESIQKIVQRSHTWIWIPLSHENNPIFFNTSYSHKRTMLILAIAYRDAVILSFQT
ncbi:hypothetical protein, partial [Yersinia enterocolitica]|uniref:hypothetical protein n=1 Tax=Yersinia enterocolitica TaxID=630 RepID=UPI0006818ADF